MGYDKVQLSKCIMCTKRLMAFETDAENLEEEEDPEETEHSGDEYE